MTAFRYRAARADGVMVGGSVDAATIPEASGLLSDRGLFPIFVEAERERTARRLSPRDEAAVLESLASFLDAGVPLQEGLRAAERLAKGNLKSAIARAAERVRQGASLSAALAAEQGTFCGVTIGLVRAGESGAGLVPALEQAVAHLEREATTRARIRSALAYPALLAIVGASSVAAITLVIVPRFAALLDDLGQELPLATQLLIAASDVARVYGVFLIAAALGAVALSHRLVKQQAQAWHRWLLSLPVIGPIRHGVASARACRTLGALLSAGTPALRALDAARDASGDAAIAERILEAKGLVAEGRTLAAAFATARVLTANAQQLAAIGDHAGRLPRMLAKAADLEDREAERRLKTLVTFVEPALILVFAAIVAFVAAALLQAVYAVRPT